MPLGEGGSEGGQAFGQAVPSPARSRAENAQSPGFSASSRGFVNKSGKPRASPDGGLEGLKGSRRRARALHGSLPCSISHSGSIVPFSNPPFLLYPSLKLVTRQPGASEKHNHFTPLCSTRAARTPSCAAGGFLYEKSLTASGLLGSLQHQRVPNILCP